MPSPPYVFGSAFYFYFYFFNFFVAEPHQKLQGIWICGHFSRRVLFCARKYMRSNSKQIVLCSVKFCADGT